MEPRYQPLNANAQDAMANIRSDSASADQTAVTTADRSAREWRRRLCLWNRCLCDSTARSALIPSAPMFDKPILEPNTPQPTHEILPPDARILYSAVWGKR